MTANYIAALADFRVNFTFNKGISFKVDPEFTHITPALLDRIWSQDNSRDELLWMMGNSGKVYGDVFVKVAYDPAWVDGVGMEHPGRVRILPINPSFCLPVDENEVLTQRGWLTADDLTTDDKVLSIDPETNERVWADVEEVNIFNWDGPVYDWQGKNFGATMTPDHRWMVKDHAGRNQMRRAEDLHTLTGGSLVLAGGEPGNFPDIAKYDDEFVSLVGWFATEGSWAHGCDAIEIGQSTVKNPGACVQIDAIAAFYESQGHKITTRIRPNGMKDWYFPVAVGNNVRAVMGGSKEILPGFLTMLTENQAELLYQTILEGDGDKTRERLYQTHTGLIDSFQMLAMLLGKRSIAKRVRVDRNKHGEFDGTVGVHQSTTANLKWLHRSERHYKGRVWCPTTSTGTWVTRRKEVMQDGSSKKVVYLTGNCFP